ncbi:MAG: F0F1 ATP synthase subunit epsilon [Gammaproteobacteria bacterium]|nr:F0F1 ATP synthase subunit epsilon [Gammaproteobacteria bacterium]MCP5198916.1 F0F1 ATP synthase subunit epsilon [Gammaproteobacteria bacterium]
MNAATDTPTGRLRLRVLLPDRVLLEREDVTAVVVTTDAGSHGLLPRRLDCAAVLLPGVLEFVTTDGTRHYVALDRGVLTKTGADVVVACRNGVPGDDLGRLRALVERRFARLGAEEQETRQVLARLEGELVRESGRGAAR